MALCYGKVDTTTALDRSDTTAMSGTTSYLPEIHSVLFPYRQRKVVYGLVICPS